MSALYAVHQAVQKSSNEDRPPIADKEGVANFSESWLLRPEEDKPFSSSAAIHSIEVVSFCSSANFLLFNHQISLSEQDLLPPLTKFIKVFKLDFQWCRLLSSHYEEIAKTVDRCENLNELKINIDVNFENYPTKKVDLIFSAIGRASHLNKLEVSFTNAGPHSRDNNILFWLDRLHSRLYDLEHFSLNIGKNYCGDDDLVGLFDFLASTRKLKSLDLNISNSFRLTGRGFDGLMASLGRIKTLDSLSLNLTSNFEASPVRSDSLANAISSLINLKKFKLSVMDETIENPINPFSYEDKLKIFEAISKIEARSQQTHDTRSCAKI